jgi:inhibitor of cysteine peptidase
MVVVLVMGMRVILKYFTIAVAATILLSLPAYSEDMLISPYSQNAMSSVSPITGSAAKTYGIQDDGKTVTVQKGETFSVRFIEYGNGDTWKVRQNPDIKIKSDVVMESYPMQHVITIEALKSTTIYFDRASAPNNGKKTMVLKIVVDTSIDPLESYIQKLIKKEIGGNLDDLPIIDDIYNGGIYDNIFKGFPFLPGPIIPGNSGTVKTITFQDNGKTITMKKGDIFEVKLEENPTTGYSWATSVTQGLKALDDSYVRQSDLLGAGGIHTWKIKATGTGIQKFSAIYKRPWEQTAQDKSFQVTIMVVE